MFGCQDDVGAEDARGRVKTSVAVVRACRPGAYPVRVVSEILVGDEGIVCVRPQIQRTYSTFSTLIAISLYWSLCPVLPLGIFTRVWTCNHTIHNSSMPGWTVGNAYV
jgi:hypothetical protein